MQIPTVIFLCNDNKLNGFMIKNKMLVTILLRYNILINLK